MFSFLYVFLREGIFKNLNKTPLFSSESTEQTLEADFFMCLSNPIE